MRKQVTLDSEVKNDEELQHKAALTKRLLEICDQDGGDFEKSERENATKCAVDSTSAGKVKIKTAEKTQCKTRSDKVNGWFTCQYIQNGVSYTTNICLSF